MFHIRSWNPWKNSESFSMNLVPSKLTTSWHLKSNQIVKTFRKLECLRTNSLVKVYIFKKWIMGKLNFSRMIRRLCDRRTVKCSLATLVNFRYGGWKWENKDYSLPINKKKKKNASNKRCAEFICLQPLFTHFFRYVPFRVHKSLLNFFLFTICNI